MSDRFRAGEEKRSDDVDLHDWIMEIRSNLRSEVEGAAESYARTVLRPALKERGGSADTVLTAFLTGIYATGWVIQKLKRRQRRTLLKALGCREDTDKLFLDLINVSWPQPTDRALRKQVKSRHSRYGRALDGALSMGIEPPDLPAAFRAHGGIGGWARVARDARRSEQPDETGMGQAPPSGAVQDTKRVTAGASPQMPPEKASSGQRVGRLSRSGDSPLGKADRIPGGNVARPRVLFGAGPTLSLKRVCPFLAIMHPDDSAGPAVRRVEHVLALPRHRPTSDEQFFDEVARMIAK